MLRGRTEGSVLVEFAICLPVLPMLHQIAFVLSDMVSRNTIKANPATVSAAPYMTASAVVLTPYDISKATEQIALLRVCDASHAWVVWTNTQTQTSAGVAATATSALTAGVLGAASIVALPAAMVTSPMIPVNPNGSVGICGNFVASSSSLTQVGQAGGFIFLGQIRFSYASSYSYGLPATIRHLCAEAARPCGRQYPAPVRPRAHSADFRGWLRD